MGTGLTIANGTWYHVFVIINSSAADVYFDTSATAANAPVGTTAFRRIGSFKTDGSAHILAFTQFGNDFWWSTPVLDVADTNPGSSMQTKTLASVPTGVAVTAWLNIQPSFASTTVNLYVHPVATADLASSYTAAPLGTMGQGAGAAQTPGAQTRILTNTSAQIAYRTSGGTGGSDVIRMATVAWTDLRGQ